MKQLQAMRKQVTFQKDFIQLVESIRNTAQLNYVKTRDIEGGYYDQRLTEIKNFAAFLKYANVKSSFVSTDVERSCFIVVTPDSGLMGGLNNHVIDEYKDLVSKCSVEPYTIVLGEKGALALGNKANTFPFSGYRETPRDISLKVSQLKDQIFEEILKGNIGKVCVVYPSSVSFSKQIVKCDTLLPCVELAGDIKLSRDPREIILESNSEDMAAYLASEWLNTRLYMVLKDAKLAEFSARVVHLSSSQQNLEADLKIMIAELNDVRKDLIDKQCREASASQLLREKKRKRESRIKWIEKHSRL